MIGNAVAVASDVPVGKFHTTSWPFVGEMRGTTPLTGEAPATYAIIGPAVPHLGALNVCEAETTIAETVITGFDVEKSIGAMVPIVPDQVMASPVASTRTPSQHLLGGGQAATSIVVLAWQPSRVVAVTVTVPGLAWFVHVTVKVELPIPEVMPVPFVTVQVYVVPGTGVTEYTPVVHVALLVSGAMITGFGGVPGGQHENGP